MPGLEELKQFADKWQKNVKLQFPIEVQTRFPKLEGKHSSSGSSLSIY